MSSASRPSPARLVPYDDMYQTCERTAAKLRVYGPTLECEQVTEYLHIQPSPSYAGRKKPDSSHPQARHVAWMLSSEGHVESKDLRRHLDWLLLQIEPAADGLKQLQSMDDVVANVVCVWWSAAGDGGPTLWPEQMRRLAELDLECSFEFAFYGDD